MRGTTCPSLNISGGTKGGVDWPLLIEVSKASCAHDEEALEAALMEPVNAMLAVSNERAADKNIIFNCLL